MSNGSGFSMLVPARPGACVLEVSEGDAHAAEGLRSAGCVVTCVRASEERAGSPRRAGFEVRVAREDAELARGSGPFDVVVLSIALGRTLGQERIVRDLRGLTRAAAAALAPGGRLVLVLPNPVYSLPLLASLIARLVGEKAAPARGPLLPRWSSVARVCRQLDEHGLVAVEAFAALPDARRIKFLIPLDGPAGALLFFRALVPRSRHVTRRMAAQLAAVAASRGLLAGFAPAFGVIASKAVAP